MSMKESGEMYLETVYVLCREKKNVRSIDVADHMSFSKPSVSRGIGLLKKEGYITVDAGGYITLTENGRETAEKIFERHTVLTNVLKAIGVDGETASEDACRIEHVISDESIESIKKHLANKK